MKLFLWKTCSIFLSATIIIFAVSANPVSTKNVSLSVDNPVTTKKCKSKTVDGISYTVACDEGINRTVSVTDSEVKDLTSFPPSIRLSITSTTGKPHDSIIASTTIYKPHDSIIASSTIYKPHDSIIASTTIYKPLSVSSTTTKINELAVDKIVQPEEQVRPNSKFNLTTGGIAAVICLSVAVVFYVGVMMWKRVVMNAYQNREILLNDDDICDINDEDMRHFEAACIQIDA